MAHPNQPRYVPPQDPSAPSAPPAGYGPPAQANGHPTYGQQVPAQYGQQPAVYGQAGQPQTYGQLAQAYGQLAQAYGAQPQGGQTVPGLSCRYCDASPAIKATAHGHRGMIIVMQFRSLKGPFCRDCGIAAVRDMSSQTLWQGWWGVGSMVVAPITLLVNLVQRVRFEGMAEPVRGYGSRPPIDKGKPLYLRPSIVGLLVPLFVLGFIMIGIVTSAAGSS